ncbi:MAG TPA: ferrochelatase [Bacteroidales bacterium]|nr:ferrochelatase [Bacteroidales bacterium]
MSRLSENSRKAILLLNVGTPDKAELGSVRKYLSEFLNDPLVVDLPWLLRKILVNLIIVPFRAPKSTKLYQQVWETNGSPLLSNTLKLQTKLQAKIGGGDQVFIAMRYGNPSIRLALNQIKKGAFDQLILVPLFPQYAQSTSQTAIQEVKRLVATLNDFPPLKIVGQFYNHPEFIQAWVSRAKEYDLNLFDHFVFSFHGLPLSHIQKIHPHHDNANCMCNIEMPPNGQDCYKATCYATARQLAFALNLKTHNYSIAFQSRLSKNWLSPFTDKVILRLAKEGKKKVLIFAPSFVADCLETKVELGVEYADLFRKAGGEKLQLLESLNDTDAWVKALYAIISESEKN